MWKFFLFLVFSLCCALGLTLMALPPFAAIATRTDALSGTEDFLRQHLPLDLLGHEKKTLVRAGIAGAFPQGGISKKPYITPIGQACMAAGLLFYILAWVGFSDLLHEKLSRLLTPRTWRALWRRHTAPSN